MIHWAIADSAMVPARAYSASAAAAPRPQMNPSRDPSASVRVMHSIPMGPNGAAIDRPIIRPLSGIKCPRSGTPRETTALGATPYRDLSAPARPVRIPGNRGAEVTHNLKTRRK